MEIQKSLITIQECVKMEIDFNKLTNYKSIAYANELSQFNKVEE